MLLDFPIEPDASTMEIISDSVYANSSVLDGRRFASEFVAKRKTDIVKTRGGGWGKSVADGKWFVYHIHASYWSLLFICFS